MKKKRSITFIDISSPVFAPGLGIFASILLSLITLVSGYLSDSVLLFTNGLLWSSDIILTILYYLAVKQRMKTPDEKFIRGYGKFESLGKVLLFMLHLIILFIYLLPGVFNISEGSPDNFSLMAGVVILSVLIIRFVIFLHTSSGRQFNLELLDYGALLWKKEQMADIPLLIIIMAIGWNSIYGFAGINPYFDKISAIFLFIFFFVKNSADLKWAFKLLLDNDIPENIQYSVLKAIADNFDSICEYRNMRFTRRKERIIIDLDIVMPDDFSLSEKYSLEKRLSDDVAEEFPEATVRIYAMPCNMECGVAKTTFCPLKKHETRNGDK